MSKRNDNNNISEKIEDNNQMKNSENNELEIFNKVNWCETEINSLTLEIDNFKEVIEKTKEYFLLELETSTDKYKQIRLQNENIYSELISFLKNENTNEISLLSEEIGKYKYKITEKDEYIENLTDKNDNLNNILAEQDNQINLLNNKISEITSSSELELNKIVNEKNDEINKITEENKNKMKNLNDEIDELKAKLNEQEDQNKILIDENNIFKLSIEEKEEQIKSLKEEIKILNSIIEEKDETLESFGIGD